MLGLSILPVVVDQSDWSKQSLSLCAKIKVEVRVRERASIIFTIIVVLFYLAQCDLPSNLSQKPAVKPHFSKLFSVSVAPKNSWTFFRLLDISSFSLSRIPVTPPSAPMHDHHSNGGSEEKLTVGGPRGSLSDGILSQLSVQGLSVLQDFHACFCACATN